MPPAKKQKSPAQKNPVPKENVSAKIVFLEVDPEDVVAILERFPDAQIHQKPLSDDALVKACKDAEIISCFIYSKFPKEVLQNLKKLRLLCTRSVGYNHIDVAYCQKNGILACNVPDYGSHVIAEHVFALLLSTLRHIHEGDKRVSEGVFDYHGLRGMSLRGKTLGIVGTGRIGSRVARIAHGFGMRILATDKFQQKYLEKDYGVKYVSFDDLIAEAKIITLHAPLLPETHHMINDVALHRMHRGTILINTARGELIDSHALLAALKGKKVAYALLDVLEHEKRFANNKELIEHPNTIVTPHIAFYSDESMSNMYNDCFESIDQWERGEVPVHVIKPVNEVCDMKKTKKAGKGNKSKKEL